MQLKILGCHGGESTDHRTAAFMLDGHLMLDAGALTRGLSLAQQLEIDHIFLSHCHMDHIRDLPLLSDNCMGLRTRPIEIHCTGFTANALKQHIFNNCIWPDFTQIPNPADPEGRPVLCIRPLHPGVLVSAGAYQVRCVPVHHTVDCQAMFVHGQSGTLVYSGDTGPTEQLWRELNQLTDLRALICEVSFPNAMAQLAEDSGHLTPALLAAELKKFSPKTQVPVLIYHLKPGFEAVLNQEIVALHDPRLRVLQPMDAFTF